MITKNQCAAALLLSLSGVAGAATVTSVAQSANVTQGQACDNFSCTVNVKAKASFSMQFTLAAGEASNFGPDTLIEVGAVSIGHEFRLGEASDYTAGATKANYTTTTLTSGIPINWKVAMDWTGGKGKVNLTVSGKGSSSAPHLDDILLSLTPDGKSHSPQDLDVSVEASNSGINVMEARARVKADVVQSVITRQTADDDVILSGNTKIKIKSFVNQPTVH